MTLGMSMSDVSLHLADDSVLLSHLDISFGPGRHGLVGRNGSGKSMLLRLLADEIAPTHGTIIHEGTRGYLMQSAHAGTLAEGDDGSSVILADVLGVGAIWRALARLQEGKGTDTDLELADGHWDLGERIAAALANLGLNYLDPEVAAERLSGGEQVRVRLARLSLERADILLLDEPTNHLDRDARQWVAKWLRDHRGIAVVASHDRSLMADFDRIVLLKEGKVRLYGGGYDAYVTMRAEERLAADHALAAAEQRRDVAQQHARETRERQSKRITRGERSAPKMGLPKILLGMRKRNAQVTAASLNVRHERKLASAESEVAAARARREVDETVAFADVGRPESHGYMLIAEELNVHFPGSSSTLWPENLSFAIQAGRRIALTGLNGSGKSTLLSMIRGLRTPDCGRLEVRSRQLAYLDQSATILDPQLNLLENLAAKAPNRPQAELRVTLGRLGFSGEAAFLLPPILSGGQRMRVSLGVLLAAESPPDLLLLDEPSNDLDLESLESVVATLSGYQGTLIVVSHDELFLEELGINEVFELQRRESDE